MALISVTEYANKIGKDPCNVRRMLSSGRLAGQKIGKQWVIEEDAVYPEDKRIINGDYKNWRKRVCFNSLGIISKSVKTLAKELGCIFGDIIDEIIVYGSYARGTQSDESDVDIALKFNKSYSKTQYEKMIECVMEKEIECGKVISVVDIDTKNYEKWKDLLPFYNNIQREGIVLWKRV